MGMLPQSKMRARTGSLSKNSASTVSLPVETGKLKPFHMLAY
jgi:hypothetical protein